MTFLTSVNLISLHQKVQILTSHGSNLHVSSFYHLFLHSIETRNINYAYYDYAVRQFYPAIQRAGEAD